MKSISLTAAIACLVACSGSPNDAHGEPATLHLIGHVQGETDTSPLLGKTVTVRGIVTGDFQDGDAERTRNLGGFFITGAADGSTKTSDGIFVFDADSTTRDVAVGDAVEVTGKVAEFFGETQLQAVNVTVTGSGKPVPVVLPKATGTRRNSDGEFVADLEAYEGMLVQFAETLTVSGMINIERFGEILLSADGRLMQFTNGNTPSVDGYASHRRAIAQRSILLDDGRRGQNERPATYVDPKMALRIGDQINGLTGVLRYARGSGGAGQQAFRLMPTKEIAFEHSNPRTEAPDPGGSLRIASLNMLNYFTTPDSGAEVCGPKRDARCRGADSAAEFTRQQQKLVATLLALNADVIGLVELENTKKASLRSIVGALNSKTSQYAYIDTGTIGDDAIKVGIIYKPSTVRPVGAFAVLDQSVNKAFNDNKNRPVLAQTFADTDGGTFTLAVNHLKSKGSDCDELGDPNRQDGQGNCNRTRAAAAAAMADWLNDDPTGSGDTDVLIVGDLNAYTREDPVVDILRRGFENLFGASSGVNSYSFVFRGQSGALDHAFASTTLAQQVNGAKKWHSNADESRLFDYNQEHRREKDWFDGSQPYRSSDHDPLIVGLTLTREGRL